VVGARGLQGHPGGAVVGQGGQEGLAAFRGVGEAKSGGLSGGGDQGQVQVGLADVNACAEHGPSPLGKLREVATRPRGPSMWMRSLTTGILCGGEAGAGGYRSKSRAWEPGNTGGRTSLRGQDTCNTPCPSPSLSLSMATATAPLSSSTLP